MLSFFLVATDASKGGLFRCRPKHEKQEAALISAPSPSSLERKEHLLGSPSSAFSDAGKSPVMKRGQPDDQRGGAGVEPRGKSRRSARQLNFHYADIDEGSSFDSEHRASSSADHGGAKVAISQGGSKGNNDSQRSPASVEGKPASANKHLSPESRRVFIGAPPLPFPPSLPLYLCLCVCVIFLACFLLGKWLMRARVLRAGFLRVSEHDPGEAQGRFSNQECGRKKPGAVNKGNQQQQAQRQQESSQQQGGKAKGGAVRQAAPVQQPGTANQGKCNCNKSKCLQLYCECFAAGRYCDETCSCKCCHNDSGHASEVEAARRKVQERNRTAFKPKIVEVELEDGTKVHRHATGCHCRKSGCLKKYCECFQAGVLCSDNCRCVDCKNCEPPADQGRSPSADGAAPARRPSDTTMVQPTPHNRASAAHEADNDNNADNELDQPHSPPAEKTPRVAGSESPAMKGTPVSKSPFGLGTGMGGSPGSHAVNFSPPDSGSGFVRVQRSGRISLPKNGPSSSPRQ